MNGWRSPLRLVSRAVNAVLITLVRGYRLLLSPWLVNTPVGLWFGMDATGNAGELASALDFSLNLANIPCKFANLASCSCRRSYIAFP